MHVGWVGVDIQQCYDYGSDQQHYNICLLRDQIYAAYLLVYIAVPCLYSLSLGTPKAEMMASKSALVVLACFLLINIMVRASVVPDENPIFQNSTSPPPPPSPAVVKGSPPPAPPAAKVLPPPVEPVKSPPPSPPQPERPKSRLECIRPCAVRCKLHSRKNICMRACLACCERCKCVPPGQYGYKELCGKCYAGMTTRGGRLKCP